MYGNCALIFIVFKNKGFDDDKTIKFVKFSLLLK